MNFDFDSNEAKPVRRLVAAAATAAPLVGAFLSTPLVNPSSKADACTCSHANVDEGTVSGWVWDYGEEAYCYVTWEKWMYYNSCYGYSYTYTTLSKLCS